MSLTRAARDYLEYNNTEKKKTPPTLDLLGTERHYTTPGAVLTGFHWLRLKQKLACLLSLQLS